MKNQKKSRNSREKSLIKNTILLSIGKFFPMLISIITLPILTARLTKAEYGTFDLISTLVMLLIPIATLQIQSAAFRFLIEHRDNKQKCKGIITNIYFVTIPIALIVAFGLLLFFPIDDFIVKVLIGIYFLVDIINISTGQIARGLSDNKGYSISAILLSIFNCIGIIILIYLYNTSLYGVLISLIIANSISIVYLLIKLKLLNYINIKLVSKKEIKSMISYSWPMIPNNLSNWILKLSDRIVITAFLGIEANAIYAVANKIPNLLSIAQSVFVMAWQENASLVVKDEDATDYYSKVFDKTYSLVIGITALIIAMTPILFIILIRGDYSESYIQIPILIIAMFFYCMAAFQGGIYIAHKKTKSVGITTMAAAGINLIIDLLLVNIIGITAGSVSTLVAYFTLYVFRMKDCLKFQKINYNIKKQIILFLVVIIMVILCAFNNVYINIINIIIGLVFCIIINKDFIIDILRELKKKVRQS